MDEAVPSAEAPDGDRPLDPEKLLRIASMVREVLEEARGCDPNATPNKALSALHSRAMEQIRGALPKELAAELDALDLGGSFADSATAQEVRLAYSGLMGWLQGLFQGLQAAFQMQAIQRQLSPGLPGPVEKKEEEEEEEPAPGRYL